MPLARAMSGKLLENLHGKVLDAQWLSSTLAAAAGKGQQPLSSSEVSGLEVVEGTERRWPQSHSGQLRVDLAEGKSAFLYLKKVGLRSLPC